MARLAAPGIFPKRRIRVSSTSSSVGRRVGRSARNTTVTPSDRKAVPAEVSPGRAVGIQTSGSLTSAGRRGPTTTSLGLRGRFRPRAPVSSFICPPDRAPRYRTVSAHRSPIIRAAPNSPGANRTAPDPKPTVHGKPVAAARAVMAPATFPPAPSGRATQRASRLRSRARSVRVDATAAPEGPAVAAGAQKMAEYLARRRRSDASASAASGTPPAASPSMLAPPAMARKASAASRSPPGPAGRIRSVVRADGCPAAGTTTMARSGARVNAGRGGTSNRWRCVRRGSQRHSRRRSARSRISPKVAVGSPNVCSANRSARISSDPSTSITPRTSAARAAALPAVAVALRDRP